MRILKEEMIDFLKSEVKEKGFERVIFGLSGGIDSAVVAFVCKEAFGSNAKALLMPSLRGSQENFEDAKILTELLKIPYEIIPLEPYERVFGSYEEIDQLRYGNFCARTRMMLLYDRSQRDRSLVVGTSNKSELMLGYGTIYGDLACAINPIGDLFKTEIFELARFLQVPEKIISKAPSADLYEGQSDEKEIGLSYDEIDSILRKIDYKNLNCSNLNLVLDTMQGKHSKKNLGKILDRIWKNKFKTQNIKIFRHGGSDDKEHPIFS